MAIGYINTLYLKPEFFKLDEIGLFGLITANAMMISPLASLGLGSSFIKFFPSFQASERNQFFTLLVLITLIGNALVIAIGYMLHDMIAERYLDTAPEYISYLSITGIIVIVNSLFELFFSFSRSILKVIFPSFLRDIFLRVGAIMLVGGYALGILNFDWAIKGLAINYSLAFFVLFTKLVLFSKLRFSFNFTIASTDLLKRLFSFSLYSMLMAGSFAILNNTTYDQVTSLLGSEANGIFITCFFIAVIVEMPRRNMGKVIAPVISTAFQSNDMKLVKSLYERSSITMSIFGSLLFIGIITNLQDLFSFIPQGNRFEAGFGVVIFVCISKLIVMISGFPGHVINFSKYYKYNLLFQLSAAIALITFNYFLIGIWGLNGAAFSYFITISLHTFVMIAYVRSVFGIHPFNKKHLVLFIIFIVVGIAAHFFDPGLNPIVNIIIRSILTSLIFVSLIYRFKISSDINELINATFMRILNVSFKK